MRVIIIILLLIVLGFIGWKAAEKFKIIEGPDQETVETPAPDTGEPTAETPAEPALPSFDIVRVDRTGYAVIAGRAKPGSEVTIFANEEELATAPVEPDGSWVVATDTPLDAGPVELSLSMKTEDGSLIRSEDTIVIYVPEREGDLPLVLRTTPGGATRPSPTTGPGSATTKRTCSCGWPSSTPCASRAATPRPCPRPSRRSG